MPNTYTHNLVFSSQTSQTATILTGYTNINVMIGDLYVNTSSSPVDTTATLTFYNNADMAANHIVFVAQMQLVYTALASPAISGNTSILVNSTNGFSQYNQIQILTDGTNPTERRRVSSISGNILNLIDNLQYNHNLGSIVANLAEFGGVTLPDLSNSQNIYVKVSFATTMSLTLTLEITGTNIATTFSDLTQITTPSNPSSGNNRAYFKSDNNFYILDSSGVETQIGSSGSGSVAQGGNSFGTTMSIGTKDNFTLAFKTNNTNKWQIDNNGHFLTQLDATYDIGSPDGGATYLRPRNIYAANGIGVSSPEAAGLGVLPGAPYQIFSIGDESVFKAIFYASSPVSAPGGPACYVTNTFQGTTAIPTATQLGDSLGLYIFSGNNGGGFGDAGYINGPFIQAFATQNFAPGVAGSQLQFLTNPNGTATATLALTLNQDQSATFTNSVIIGTGALSTSATDGFLYIPTCAGAPIGVPTSHTGTAALVYDTTDNKLWVYNGSWVGVTLS